MNRKIRWLKQIAVGGLFAAALAISGAGNAQNFVQNGDFTNATPNSVFTLGSVPDWTNIAPFTFIYGPGGADTVGAGPTPTELWGPGNGSSNGLPATSPPPDGGNYLATDSGFPGAITDTLSAKLTVNDTYVLNFDYAAAQFHISPAAYNGATQSAWQVTAGGPVLTGPGSSTLLSQITTTPVLSIPSHGFSGWQEDSVPFTATAAEAASGLLTFLAVGTPSGDPPAVLLDSVSIMNECEPGSVASYIGTTCVKGDKEFSNFKYTPTAIGSAIASSALQTTITPVMSGNNYGFDINGIWDAGPNSAADAVLSYTVQSLAGNTIDDASLSLTGSAIGGGFATVGETICENDPQGMSDGCASGTSATLQASLPSDPTDSITFPATDLVDISKDIDVFGGTGFASLSDVINTVSQIPSTSCSPACDPPDPPDPPTVPEPASLALLGVGLAGLAGVGLIRRTRC